MNNKRHHWTVSTRRQFFEQAGSGLAAIALTSLLQEEALAQEQEENQIPSILSKLTLTLTLLIKTYFKISN